MSAGTPCTCTLTSGSTMEDFLLFTLGSCCPDITCWRIITTGYIILGNHNYGRQTGANELAFWVRSIKLNHDMERLVLQPVSSRQGDGVKVGPRVPHEGRLQDVAALSVDQESALVHVHFRAVRLKVQGHYRDTKRVMGIMKRQRAMS